MRSKIVLGCASGATNLWVAEQQGISRMTVGKWWFVRDRLAGLSDEPRPGEPRTISDDLVEALIVTTLESKPADATHWSTRTMAAATGMSQTAVSRIWRAFGLKPHLAETFKLSTDAQFVEKVRDIVGLYLNPPQAALVLWVDEKTQVQALDRSARVPPGMPGTPERVTKDYLRAGTTDLFAALDVATGTVITQMRAQLIVAQSRRTLVRRDHHETHPPRCAPLRRRPKTTSNNGPSTGTTIHARTCGARRPTRSSNHSPHIAYGLTTQNTRYSPSPHGVDPEVRRSSVGQCCADGAPSVSSSTS